MKKLWIVCLALCMLLMIVAAVSAVAQQEAATVNGYVSDSQCGAKGAAATHEACMKKCLAKGAKVVVVTDSDQKVLTVDNPDALTGHEGHHVAATGHVNGDSIHIDSVKML
jgi:hypothetical protein